MTDRGPADVYEVTWRTGHIERVLAHQVTWPGSGAYLLGQPSSKTQQIVFHAEINGRWLLTLSADEEDIRTVRLVTDDEPIPSDGGTP